jgi:Bacteriocin-protection, YdeI or OmpD-Associated/Domain of unknown function (DUF1905)
MNNENTYIFNTTVGDDVWGHSLVVPPIYAEMFKSADKTRRVICVVNGSLTLHCAIMPHGDAFYISMNKTNLKKLGLKVGSPVEISIRKDNSDLGLPMPEELAEVLEQDPIAKGYFDQLTAGKKRSLIHIVIGVKNVDKRVERALMIADKLCLTKGIFKANEFWGG